MKKLYKYIWIWLKCSTILQLKNKNIKAILTNLYNENNL